MRSLLPCLLVGSLLAGCGGGGSGGHFDVASDAGARTLSAETGSAEFASSACEEDAFTDRIVAELNALRAAGQVCGGISYPPAPPVTWSCQLEQAAVEHSEDMASHDFFSHTGSDGLRVSHRATEASYRWQRLGENIAGGHSSIPDVFQGWLDSPSHCSMMMGSAYDEAGLALRSNSGSYYVNYWTLVLGKAY